MRRILIPILTLAGCAAPDALRTDPPKLTLDISLKPEQVRDCTIWRNVAGTYDASIKPCLNKLPPA